MKDLLHGFPVVVEFPVAWGEMDAQLHVNNVVYFRYIENSRMAYFDRIGVLKMMEEEGVGTVLASTECRYRSPITYPDTISVGARVTRIDADRFTMEYRLVSHAQGKVAAEGKGVLVTFNILQNRKAPFPQELKRRILALEASVGAVPAQT